MKFTLLYRLGAFVIDRSIAMREKSCFRCGLPILPLENCYRIWDGEDGAPRGDIHIKCKIDEDCYLTELEAQVCASEGS